MRRIRLADRESAEICSRSINQGGVACVPTDTVYGLVCHPRRTDAIERIFQIKQRPKEKPFALFVGSIERMLQEPVTLSETGRALCRRYWPGSLTIVISAGASCPGVYKGKVGVRCPNHPWLREVMAACGGLLINTSLNKSGEPAVCSLDGLDQLLDETDLVVDGGVLPRRRPSTVVDCTGRVPAVLREGDLSEQDLDDWLKTWMSASGVEVENEPEAGR